MIWLSLVCLALAGIAKGYLDSIADNGTKSEQWVNKWKNVNEGLSLDYRKKYHWWYFGLYVPAQYLEKFPFSSTILVSLTDKWHLAQLIMLRFFYCSIALGYTSDLFVILLSVFVVFPIILGIPFQITHTKNKKTK